MVAVLSLIHIFINRNQLSSKFKKETGKTLNEFVIHERIQRAKSLLINTDKPLAEISNYLGFSSQSYFHNVFKRYTGQTPNEFRTGGIKWHKSKNS